MTGTLSNEVETIVGTLLVFSEKVVVTARDLCVLHAWGTGAAMEGELQLTPGNRITEILGDPAATQFARLATEAFECGKNGYLEYPVIINHVIVLYTIRILPIHPDKSLLFVAVENLSKRTDLESEHKRLKLALEATGDSVWEVNFLNNTVGFSDKWRLLFGYDKEEITSVAEWGSKVHPDDLERAGQLKEDYISGKTVAYAAELRFLCKDGSYKWILSRAVAMLKTNDGRPLRCVGTHTDISVQKNAELQMEDLRIFYENILHNIPADIAVFDGNHRYLFVNRNAYKNEEVRKWVTGKTDADYARLRNRPDSFYETRYALYDKARDSGQQVELVEKMTARDGSQEHHLRIIKPVFSENKTLEYLLAYGLNITDLIATQEALKTSADTFSSAFDHSGTGKALLSPDGKFMDINSAFCKMLGYTREEMLAMTFQDITHPDDLDRDLESIERILKKEIESYSLEKRYFTRTGEIVWVLLTVSLVWKDEDTPNFFIGQVIDITEKKELEHKIKRKNIELEASEASLINKVSQLEELSQIIAHNLRGPAGNIRMLAELLMEHREKGRPAKGANPFSEETALQFVHESSNALISSLDTLMEITQIKLNKEIPYDHCDMPQVVSEITAQLQSVIYEKQAVIKTAFEVSQINYPKAYLENILYNLVSNALKYSKPGLPPEILISVHMAGNRTRITVKDNGLGIDMAQYGDRVFKLNQVFHKGYDSRGVGLYLTKTQVESLGGAIEVNSKLGEGAEFMVTL